MVGRSFGDRSIWRPALDALRVSLDLREVAEVRQQYERMREDHGFRLLDYSVDADAASPRACFQFSEDLPGKRADFSPFVTVAGQDKPALSAQERQLCVEGLKHGERYSITLRAGIPSLVKETLSKSADFNIYVRDRKPLVRFTGKAYVLPRSGQRGIPVVSVNTAAVELEIYRIGDRNLLETVVGREFQRTLDRYDLNRLTEERGSQVWKGEMTVEQTLNTDVTTAFPVDQAIGTLAPGVYVVVAQPAGAPKDDFDSLATQWFIISDLGLTAFSGNDGIHAFVHSLDTAQSKSAIEVRLLSRGNEELARKRTSAAGHVQFEANLTRGEGALAPAMLIATDANGDYAFLSLKTPPFDLSDRGVSGRVVPAGLDAFVYTERGVYRSGETVQVTTLLRDGQGIAALNVPLTLVVERPDGVEYRRSVVPDQGVGGRALAVTLVSTAPTGTWRVRAFADPKRPPVGEATFMVEDYVPDRLEFELASNAKGMSRKSPAEITVDGRYLYGAPAGKLELEGEVVVSPATERPGFARYQFGLADEDVETVRQPLDNLPDTDENGKARLALTLEKQPATTRPLEAQVIVRMAEPGGRAVERKLTLPVIPDGPMIGVKPLFSGRSLGEGENAAFDVVLASPDGTSLAGNGLRYELLKIETKYQWYRRDGAWDFEPTKSTKRVADGQLDVAADKPGRVSVPVQWGRYRLEVSSADRNGPVTSIDFDAGWYAEASADTPDLLEIALDKPEYVAGRQHDGRGDRAHGRQGHAERDRRPPGFDGYTGRDGRYGAAARSGRQRLGQRRLCRRHASAAARCKGGAHARPSHRRAVVFDQSQGAHACARNALAGSVAAQQRAAHSGEGQRPRPRRGGADRRCRGRCRHSQPDQLQAAGAGRLLPRSAPAHRRYPRPLRATDRRHARRTRPDQDRRRRRRRRAAGLAAHAKAARALFRNRRRQARRHRRGSFRHTRFCRHRAGDGRRLVQGQGRPRRRRSSPSAIRWSSPRRCRGSCSAAIAAPCISISTMWRANPAITGSR